MASSNADYDVLIKGGTLIDTLSKTESLADIAISNGRIADIGPNLSGDARCIVDATGQYVTPGLVDLHTHVYWGSTYWGLEADPICARTGVTTVVDAGSAGAYTFPGFKRFIISQSLTRVFSFLHISAIGLTGRTFELSHEENVDVELAVATIQANRDHIKGIKVRVDADTSQGSDKGVKALKKAREVADAVGLPVMVHIAKAPPTLEDVVGIMAPGDILTHCCTGHSQSLVDENYRLKPVVEEMRSRGILLDLGHGSGSFSWSVAEAMVKQGQLPDVISSDLHQLSALGPLYDLPTTLSKFLHLGVPLHEVIARATLSPSKAIGCPELGRLHLGGPADIAVFRLEKGEFKLKDAYFRERVSNIRLVNTLTLRGGKEMPFTQAKEPHPWVLRDVNKVAGLGEKLR
ncbi:uncharacterized protein VTP21DRAFT_6857 [Calcarisporiella thermophila]|uniref:uncharacterized protein n=1 Tax=Calcarisporiella thermophila TaxID=911321 RepID=UPI00374231BD